MTLNSILNFIKSFVGWHNGKTLQGFQVLIQHQYKDGILLRVSRESVTSRQNKAQVATLVWVSNKRSQPFLFLFLDTLEGNSIRYLTHRIQILSSDRHLIDDSVKVYIHLSQSYYLGTYAQANSVLFKLVLYCRDKNYSSIDFNWEIDAIRKQLMVFDYTEFSQEKAREDYRYNLDRVEMRSPAPTTLNPILLEKINIFLEPKPNPPKSHLVEILLIGGILIGITWLLVN